MFLLTELLERGRAPGAEILAVTAEAFVEPQDELEQEAEVGFAIPGTMALLGSAFMLCALAIAGLPPMPVFIGKFAVLDAVLKTGDITIGSGALLALLMVSGFAALVGLARSGIRRFWASDGGIPRIRVVEIAPVILLLGLCAALTLNAGAAARYLDAAAEALHAPRGYIQEVLSNR
jgi:multicomponent K+:H+ antiporter subunit D